MSKTDGKETAARRLLLLMGSPRSGTSWLAKLLDTHPDVLYLHEPLAKLRHSPADPRIRQLIGMGSLKSSELADLVKYLNRAHHECYRPPFFPKDFNRVPRWMTSAMWMATSISSLGKRAFRWTFSPRMASDHDLLIKEVDWQSHASKIVDGLNPDSLIFIVRHPCAVVSSRLHGLKMGVIHGHDRTSWLQAHGSQSAGLGFTAEDVQNMEPWEFYALDWTLQNLNYRRIAKSRPRVLTIIYEQLCLDPERVINEAFAFLGWEPNRLTYRFIRASTRSGLRLFLMRLWGGKRHYYDLYRDAIDSATGWKKSLTAQQQRDILTITRKFPQMNWWTDQEATEDISPAAETQRAGEIAYRPHSAVDAVGGITLSPKEVP